VEALKSLHEEGGDNNAVQDCRSVKGIGHYLSGREAGRAAGRGCPRGKSRRLPVSRVSKNHQASKSITAFSRTRGGITNMETLQRALCDFWTGSGGKEA